MTLTKGLSTVALTALACGAAGLGLGWGIGRFAPDSYRTVFAHAPPFDPVQVGVALGLAQGVLAGLAVGAIVVGLVTWYEIRTADRERPES